MNKQFYSRGKLLITGEYLVLNGAKVLSVPLKLGQKMAIKSNHKEGVRWKNYYLNNCWFDASIDTDTFRIIDNQNKGNNDYLRKLLVAARKLNPDFLLGNNSFSIKNNLEFDPGWGLGSSSTLISNLAYWAKIDPFELGRHVSKGSGYDIACARSDKSIIYQNKKNNRIIDPISFQPPFTDNLYLVWLGNKINTEQSIEWYSQHKKTIKNEINVISQLSIEVSLTNDFSQFQRLISEHNNIMEKVLKTPSVQNQYFKDFKGVIKQLGAWGGDFILAASDSGLEKVKSYFLKKKRSVIFRWDDIVLG